VAAQNCHQKESGAYTGEISASMLSALGIDHVIIGHSERREYFHETNAILAQKVDVALKHGLGPIFCCGEPLDIRQAGNHVAHVKTQLQEGLFHLDKADLLKIIVAYEPIWAIGTGVTASREQAQEMHQEIRTMLADQYGQDIADQIPILYGGSVNAGNASDLFSQPDVDGGLVGGASLKEADFAAIIQA
jgi:triosephosphate isomerase